MDRLRHSIDNAGSAPLPSPLLKERFSRSTRVGNRPSTFSTVSFLGSERSPRFYEKVVRWFRRKRGKDFPANDAFPTEKHSNAHHNAVLAGRPWAAAAAAQSPILSGHKNLRYSTPRSPRPRLVQSSLTTTVSSSEGGHGSPRSLSGGRPAAATPSTAGRLSPVVNSGGGHLGGCGGRLPLSSTNSTGSTGSAAAHQQQRGLSMESGYYSFSTCSSPASVGGQSSSPSVFRRERSTRFRFLTRAFKAAVKGNGKSLSEEIPEAAGEDNDHWQFRSTENATDVADDRRRMFQSRTSAFHSAVNEEDGGGVGDDDADDQEDFLRTESRTSSYCNSSVFSGSQSSLPPVDTHEIVALTLGDFRIKYSELQFAQRLSSTQQRSGGGGFQEAVHAGKCQVWDVNIHSCCPRNDEEVRRWLADVRRLTQIRHENIVLYMGACVEPPRFAIITSRIKAESLYTHTVAAGRSRLSPANKLAILRQTANALSYLHCKGILHGRLSTHNIFLESSVKVSLLDYAPSLLNLQYLSPELARRLPFQPDAPDKSKEGDIFAFGSVMYHLVTGRLPLDNLPAQAALFLVGQGDLVSHLSAASLNPGLTRMIERCWNKSAELRPSFPVLCSLLQPLASSIRARKHSLSEPRNLDQAGRQPNHHLAPFVI